MFERFHVLVGLLIKLQPEKKGTLIWPSFGMFGGSMSSDCFDGFLNQNTTGKTVQLSGHWLQCLETIFTDTRLSEICWELALHYF
jgi:hypothetical protein